MTTQQALLETILANPDDDTARLVYADWLDENGDEREAEHAKLIRHQCDDPDGEQVAFTFSNIYGHDLSRTGPPYLVLWGRGPKTQELANFAACSTNQAWRPIGGVDLSSRVVYRRGFVEFVSCPWNAWRDHGDAILAKHPVTKVRLTTEPEIETRSSDGGRRLGIVRLDDEKSEWSRMPGGNNRNERLETLLRKRWPSVKEWELPREEDHGRELPMPDSYTVSVWDGQDSTLYSTTVVVSDEPDCSHAAAPDPKPRPGHSRKGSRPKNPNGERKFPRPR